MQGVNFKPKEDKAKHGLKIRPKKISFWNGNVRASRWGEGEREKRREEKKKEKGRREEEENLGLKLLFGTSFLFGIFLLVWKVWNLYMDLLVRKLP